MDTAFVIGCIACTLVPLVSFLSCRLSFSGGSPAVVESPWLQHWPRVCAFSTVAVLGAFLVETLIWGAGVLVALRWAFAVNLVVVSAWSDIKDRVISNKQVLWGLGLGVGLIAIQVALEPADARFLLIDSAAGAVVGGGVFLVSRVVTRGGVGFGDVKLFCAIGLLVGMRGVINVLAYTVFSAFVVAVVLLALKRKKLADNMPLGPFSLFGVVVAVAFGV